MFRVIIFIGLSLFVQNLLAQQGPNIVCHDCDGLDARPLPFSGSWYNP